jgi:S1-C subfamily serine protease
MRLTVLSLPERVRRARLPSGRLSAGGGWRRQVDERPIIHPSSPGPGSIYRRLGIESGDVVRRINGELLDSPDMALELYNKLHDEKWIDVELERGGKPVLNVYRIE